MYFNQSRAYSNKTNMTAQEDTYRLPQIYCSRGKCKYWQKCGEETLIFVLSPLRENKKQLYN